jgi:predicted amidohydrolase YtcJ
MYREHIQEAIDSGYKTGDIVPGTDGLVTVGSLKMISDGSLGTRTACCHHAYPSPPASKQQRYAGTLADVPDLEPDDFGLLTYTPEDFRSMFELANTQRFRLAIHTIGDKTASVIFDELEKLAYKPLAGSSIEHAQLMLEEDLPRMKALGLAASVQPQHLNDDRELSERFWPGRTARAFAYKAIADAGIELRLGSDAPVAPLDPWMAIAAAISRLRKGEKGEGWHPEQKLTIEQAYAASTSGRRLRVREGDIADLCILPFDPLRAMIDEIWEMQPSATLLAGRFTWNNLR